MDFHKGCQIENCFRYFLYLNKEPIRRLNVKVPAFHTTIVQMTSNVRVERSMFVLSKYNFVI